MILSIFLLFVFSALTLWLLGFIFKNWYTQLFSLAGSILFIILAIVMFNSGVDFPTGHIVNDNASGYTSEVTYTNNNGSLMNALSLLMLLLGLYLLLLTTDILWKGSNKGEAPTHDDVLYEGERH